MKTKLIVIIALFCSNRSLSQTFSSGDSSVVSKIDQYLSNVYDTQDTTLYFLTKTQVLKIPVVGTRIYVQKKKGDLLRIGISSLTNHGDLGTEYWFNRNTLIFVYQSFSYYKEIPSLTQALNFKGESYWESRYYFEGEVLKYEKTTGIKDASMKYQSSDLLKEKNQLMKFITTN